jgi:acyl-coenzyme A thioesterase PaaI-like protein
MASELFNDLKKYEAALRRKTHETGATSLLGLSLETLEKGHVVFSMRVKPRHKQVHGVVHGGVLATVADTVAAIAAYTTVPKGTEIATVEDKFPGSSTGWANQGRRAGFADRAKFCGYGMRDL